MCVEGFSNQVSRFVLFKEEGFQKDIFFACEFFLMTFYCLNDNFDGKHLRL